MMGATHGLAGLAAGGGLVLAARAIGADIDAGAAAATIAAAAVAAELPDLDLRTSRISHGTSSLTAVPGIGRLALLVTLPVVLAGIAIRRTGVTHRGPTHSFAAAVLWAIAVIPIYLGYWAGLEQLAELAARHAPLLAGAPGALDSIGDAWLSHAPLLAAAVLAGGLTHLQLDDMTGAGQQLGWPFSRQPLSSPLLNIPVGGWKEAVLVAAPLGAVMLTVLWHVSAPEVQFGALEPGDQFVSCVLEPSECDLRPPALPDVDEATRDR